MKESHHAILVPVDFRESSLAAMKFACKLNQMMKGEIHLLYVINKGDMISEIFRSPDELVKVTEEATKRLDELVEQAKKGCDAGFHTKVIRGKTYEAITDYATEIQARFIIMGDNHAGQQGAKVLGHNASRVIRESPCPVITIKKEVKEVLNRIVVPVDLSKGSSKQVFSAIAIAMHYQASLHLVSVVIGGIGIWQSRIYSKLKKLSKTIEENGIESTFRLYKKTDIPPYRRVLEYAREVKADSLLLMTHQEKVTHDNYIGAFAFQLVNEAEVPVISLTSRASELEISDVLNRVIDPFGILKS